MERTVKGFKLLGTEVLQVRLSAALPVMRSQVMVRETGSRPEFFRQPVKYFHMRQIFCVVCGEGSVLR